MSARAQSRTPGGGWAGFTLKRRPNVDAPGPDLDPLEQAGLAVGIGGAEGLGRRQVGGLDDDQRAGHVARLVQERPAEPDHAAGCRAT